MKALEKALLGFLQPKPSLSGDIDPRALFECAELHGVTGVVLDAWRASQRSIPPELARKLELQTVARELDHAAHLELLRAIDRAFTESGLVGVVLKGPLFAERYYARPSARATSDVDLLVDPKDLDRASEVLTRIGYVAAEGLEEDRFRREHHHLHFSRGDALPLELHFHGYTGFGEILASPPLMARRQAASGFHALFVLAPEDELVFLAVHAAMHRFVRLGWLYDLALLTRTMTDHQLRDAAERAAAAGYSKVLAFTAKLMVQRMGAPLRLLDLLAGARSKAARVAQFTVDEPKSAIGRSATRMMYTVALCDKKTAAARYLFGASAGHLRRLLHLPP